MEVLTQTINKANGSNPDLVAVMGGEPEEMFRRAISELGGMKQFVKPGQKVVVKPNIGWDKVPELAGNTNPKLIEEIVRQCFAAGAKEVVVFDHTCDDWQKCYKNSGIEAAAKKAGAKVMPAHLESYYKPIDLPKGKKMKKAKVHEAILDCDVWINVPILKNHGGANLTISMKKSHGDCVGSRILPPERFATMHRRYLYITEESCTQRSRRLPDHENKRSPGTLCIRCCTGKRIVYLTGYCSRGYGCCQVLQSST